jgi:Putative esterase
MNGTWSVHELGGHRADVYDPPGRAPRFGVLYLHAADGATLVDRPAFTHWFDELNLGCVCPHGGFCCWVDRVCPDFDAMITPEKYLLDVVVPFLLARWTLSSRALGLLGVEMGGQGVLRLAFRHPERFAVVSALSPAIEYDRLHGRGTPLDEMYDSREQCRQDTAILHIHPVQVPRHIFFCCNGADPDWLRGCDRLHEKLSALGVAHQCDLGAHPEISRSAYVEANAERAVRALTAGLEQESRRLM